MIVLVTTVAPVDVSSCHTWCHAVRLCCDLRKPLGRDHKPSEAVLLRDEVRIIEVPIITGDAGAANAILSDARPARTKVALAGGSGRQCRGYG